MARVAVLFPVALALALAACRPRSGEASTEGSVSPAAERVERAAQRYRTPEGYFGHGNAELSRYALYQSLHGETHLGEAVLVFEKKPFDLVAQAEFEGGDSAKVVEVLSLVAERVFFTGLHPHTLSTVVYDPFDPRAPSPIEASHSAIEWLGSSYQQWNRDAAGFEVLTRSHFDADGHSELPDVLLEDQLFTQIRIDPAALPVGVRTVVPGLHFLRLEHLPVRGYAARFDREEGPSAGHRATERLTVYYPELGRTLRIDYERRPPHGIVGFEEALEVEGSVLCTEARRTHVVLVPLEEAGGPEGAELRRALGLERRP